MRSLKTLVMAFVAVLMLGALIASTAAGTMTLPEFRTAEAFTGTSGKGVFRIVGGEKIECKSDTSEGGPETGSKHLGTFRIDFAKCKTLSGLVPCNSLGDTTEVILVTGSWHIVLKQRPTHLWFILFLPARTHIECAGVLIVQSGTLLGQVTPTGTSTKSFTIKVATTNNEKNQEFTEYENEAEAIQSATLSATENEGTSKGAVEESAENVIKTANANEILN